MARWDDPHTDWRRAFERKGASVTVAGDPLPATIVPPQPFAAPPTQATTGYQWAMLAMTAGVLVLSFKTYRRIATTERYPR